MPWPLGTGRRTRESACGAGELANAFAHEGQPARAGKLLACRRTRRGRRGLVPAVVAVVDDDPICVSVFGPRPRGELGLGGITVLGDRRRPVNVGVVDAPGGPLVGN